MVSQRFLDFSVKNNRSHKFVIILNIDIEVVFSKKLDKEFLLFVRVFILKNNRSQRSVVDSEVVKLYPGIEIIVSISSFF